MHPKVKRLFEIRLLVDEQQCPEFSTLCEELAEESDAKQLPDLFRVFTDKTEHHEVMADLQGVVESFPPKVYVNALNEALAGMLPEARGWAKQLLRTILQSSSHAALMRTARGGLAADQRKATAALFEEIAKETPKVKDVALEMAHQ